GTINAIAISGDDVYIAGTFTTVGRVLASHVARWDGNQWHPLGTGVSSNIGAGGTAFALAISGNSVYVGGLFNTAGGVSVNNIARWDGSQWYALGSGITGISTSFV